MLIRIFTLLCNSIKIMSEILRILGVKDFYKYEDIVKQLKSEYSTEDFDKHQSLIFVKSPELRVWMIGSNESVFFVSDTGTDFKTVYKVSKKDIPDFSHTEGEQYAKLIFEDSKKEIPFDKSITGGTQSVIATFKKFLNE